MADLARTQFLRLGRGAKERVDLSLGKKLHWRYGRTQYPIEVLAGVEPYVGGHASHIQMRDQAEGLGAHFPSLQIPNVADAFVRKQFEAADMHTAHYCDWFTGIDRCNGGCCVYQREIQLSAPNRRRYHRRWRKLVLDFGKAFRAQQLVGDILRRDADASVLRKADGRYFRRLLLGQRIPCADEACCADR